jgi:hypothetical protein
VSIAKNDRPLAVTLIAWVYIAAGTIGFGYHFKQLTAGGVFHYNVLWVELIRLAAVVSGAFMLRGLNWARWLALAWMGFHVIVSAFHAWTQFAIHVLFFALIAWILWRPDAGRYFRTTGHDRVI